MEDFAVINYDEKTLEVVFNEELFLWSLDDGDVGDFWHSFKVKGKVYDVNFYLPDLDAKPSVYVYGTYIDKDSGARLVDTMKETGIAIKIVEGEINNYFK